MTAIDYLIRTTPYVAEEISADRETGHRMVMSLFPHTADDAARAAWNVLWTVLPGSIVLVRTTFTGRLRWPDWAKQYDHRPTTQRVAGDRVAFTVELAALRTPRVRVDPELHNQLKAGADGTPRPPGEGKAYRANKVPVPREELDQWLRSKLARHGVDVDEANVHWYRTVRLPAHRDSLPVTRVHATGTVVEAAAYNRAKQRADQMGKGKSYGTGCIAEDNESE